MPRAHECELVLQNTADPRSPLERAAGGLSLPVGEDECLNLSFCPFCGDDLATGKPPESRAVACQHLAQLERERRSSVVRSAGAGIYELMGRDSVRIRLFFCPICGSKLPTEDNRHEFHERSAQELADWGKLASGVRTIAQALDRFGKPDLDQGPTRSFFFPGGVRTEVGTNRALFYENLAQSFTVAAIEWADGRFDIKFYPKEKRP
jgi:hypothetical protein